MQGGPARTSANAIEALIDAGALQSLCKACYDSTKQTEERRGYSREVGTDGFPLDPRHPGNR